MFVEIYHILFQYEIIHWVQKEFPVVEITSEHIIARTQTYNEWILCILLLLSNIEVD